VPTLAERYAGKRVLVTGGLGFIGSNLALALAQHGAEVTLLDALLPAYGGQLLNVEPIRDRVRISLSDLRDADRLRDVVAGQEMIFALAGQMSHLRSMRDPVTDLEINCHSQLSLLECCRAVNPEAALVLASTRQVYGRPQYLPVDEAHPTLPVDVNGVHKLAAEMYYRLYWQVHGLRTVTLRLTNTYGPRMDLSSPDKGVLGVFLRQALTGETLRVYGSGEQRRDFTYVDDVVEALLLAGICEQVTGKAFNLGHPQPYSLLAFARLLQTLTGCRYECIPFPEDQRAIDIGDYWGDFSRFHTLTGWNPAVNLGDGLQRTVAFFRAHAEHYLPARHER
jgi:UDP-glucose 4-epimerase